MPLNKETKPNQTKPSEIFSTHRFMKREWWCQQLSYRAVSLELQVFAEFNHDKIPHYCIFMQKLNQANISEDIIPWAEASLPYLRSELGSKWLGTSLL